MNRVFIFSSTRFSAQEIHPRKLFKKILKGVGIARTAIQRCICHVVFDSEKMLAAFEQTHRDINLHLHLVKEILPNNRVKSVLTLTDSEQLKEDDLCILDIRNLCYSADDLIKAQREIDPKGILISVSSPPHHPYYLKQYVNVSDAGLIHLFSRYNGHGVSSAYVENGKRYRVPLGYSEFELTFSSLPEKCLGVSTNGDVTVTRCGNDFISVNSSVEKGCITMGCGDNKGLINERHSRFMITNGKAMIPFSFLQGEWVAYIIEVMSRQGVFSSFKSFKPVKNCWNGSTNTSTGKEITGRQTLPDILCHDAAFLMGKTAVFKQFHQGENVVLKTYNDHAPVWERRASIDHPWML